jgi:hypothetical protein
MQKGDRCDKFQNFNNEMCLGGMSSGRGKFPEVSCASSFASEPLSRTKWQAASWLSLMKLIHGLSVPNNKDVGSSKSALNILDVE